MHKRNTGYILLALLVVTGLASQVYNPTITQKERSSLHTNLKSTKKHILETVGDLSEQQMNFRPSAHSWSVGDCVRHLALSEEKLWKQVEAGVRQSASTERSASSEFSDEEVVTMAKDRVKKEMTDEVPATVNTWKTTEEALDAFKDGRTRLMKYVKTTTHDLRNHAIEDLTGTVDAYQMLLFISAHSDAHTRQIIGIMSHPKFPK